MRELDHPARPVVSAVTCASSCLLTLGHVWPSASPWLKSSAAACLATPHALWSGERYWAILTSPLVHSSWHHLVWGIFWVGALGGLFEIAYGWKSWLLFYCGSCLATTGGNLILDGATGMGASGLFCALLALGWISRERVTAFKAVATDSLVIFIIVLLIVDWLETASVPTPSNNGAHFLGLLYGGLFAASFIAPLRPSLTVPALFVLLIACAVPVFWAPWSGAWVSSRAALAYHQGRLAEADKLARRGLSMGEDPAWSWKLLALTRGTAGDVEGFDEAIAVLAEIDPQAAEEVRSELPQRSVSAGGTVQGGAASSTNQVRRPRVLGPRPGP